MKKQRRTRARRRRKERQCFTLGFLNLQGARREQKWVELYRALDSERFSMYGVVETHLRDLEGPPIDAEWCWAGCNREEHSRRGGGVGVLWRRDLQWQRVQGNCVEHLWVAGEMLGRPTAVCVLYLSPQQHQAENVHLVECVRQDAIRLAAEKQLIILGDFNGHLSELDGRNDANGRLLLQLAQELNLVIANLEPRCEGQATWCARGSSTTIDYALVTPNLLSALRTVAVDEDGLYSLGSDHNRLRLDFSYSCRKTLACVRSSQKAGVYLPSRAIERVAEEFEACPQRRDAKTYAEYMAALHAAMRGHMVRDSSRPRRKRNSWWDPEVEAAWRARRQANRDHRTAAKKGRPEEVAATWSCYVHLKQRMQALVQAKLAEHNLRLMKTLRADGKSAAQKFWEYVRSMDRQEPPMPHIKDATTGQPAENQERYLTLYYADLYGAAVADEDTNAESVAQQLAEVTPEETEPRWAVSRMTVDRALTRIGARTAPGPDKVPACLVKGLGPDSREQLAEVLTSVIEGAPIPEDWKHGRVVLIPKCREAAGNLPDYRPITITSVMYRLFASILKEWLSGWVEDRGVLTDLQNGFRPGRRLDDNIFVITQCAAIARKEGRSLLCCFMDVEKAYDNVPHAALFSCLIALGLPKALVSIIRRTYVENTITVHFGAVSSGRIVVTKGLRQGCPLSPLLYVVYASSVERALLKSCLGFRLRINTSGIDEGCRLPGLAFADDLVVMAESTRDLQSLVDICHTELSLLGLRFSAKKTAIVRLAGVGADEAEVTLGGDKLAIRTSYRYLGVHLSAEKDVYAVHEAALRKSAVRAQCILRRRCLWGCNRYLMVRDLWKLVHVPALTFANAVVCLSAPTRQWIERRQREVGRIALGCHGHVAVEAIQGEMGWSTFEAREAISKLAYRGRLLFLPRERWARRVFEYMAATCIRTDWARRIYQLEKQFGFFKHPVVADSASKWKAAVRQRVEEAEGDMWRSALETKSSLALYREHKRGIGPVRLYDNSLGSSLLFEARAGALRTVTRRSRFDPEVSCTLCRVCGTEEESAEHVVLRCSRLSTPATEGVPLPQALGFPATEDGAGEGDAPAAAGGRIVDRAIVATKRRLAEWWSAVHRL